MRKKWVLWIALVLVIIITFFSLFHNLTISHTDAEGLLHNSSIQIANSHVEMIRVTLPTDTTTIHIRDRRNLVDMNLEYANKELILQKWVNHEESVGKIVSIGKDFNTGELVGSTWHLSRKATLDNRVDLQKSIVDEILIRLKANEWKSVSEEIIQGRKVDKIKSENSGAIEYLYFDFETGLPVRHELFNKDQLGNPLSTAERIEDYSYYDAIPPKYLDTKQVIIQKGPAPIQRDIAD